MERPVGQAKTIQSQKSGAVSKPPHGEHRKVQSKVDRTLRGVRENEAGCLLAIRHSRKSLGTLLERREPLPFLYLNKNYKQRSHEL
jgi:hypothetical protein